MKLGIKAWAKRCVSNKSDLLKMSSLKFIFSCLVLFASTHGQTVFNFDWPGENVLPLDNTVIMPPDSARIQIANEGTVREIRIRENIDATVDCSLILEDFQANFSLTDANVTVRWFVRRFRETQMIDMFETLVTETVNPDPLRAAFEFNGTVNEILIIRRSSLPQAAKEGNAGDYRCEVCQQGSTTNCANGGLSVSVISYPPVIASGPSNFTLGTHFIGTDFCILPENPRVFILTCTHNTSLPTTSSIPMRATWNQNGQPRSFLTSYTESTSLVLNSLLYVETFRAGLFESILGEYECLLENLGGNDTATSTVTKCCEDSDIVIIANSTGFVAVPPNGMLVIGQSTCLAGAEGLTTITCPSSSGSHFYEVVYSWMKDGELIEGERNVNISVSEHGLYTCKTTTECDEDTHTSQLYSLPNIDSFTGSITDVVGDGCGRVGSPDDASLQLCPKPTEQFVLSCDSIYPYTITGPGGTMSDGPLVISEASSSNVGQYTCSSTNLCGTDEGSFLVGLGVESGEWDTSEWSSCSVQCGDGVRTRQVTCIGTVSRSSISEALCEGMRPSSSEACAGPSCQIETPVWTYEDWTKCSKYCGIGTRTRSVYCHIPSTQETVDDAQCTGPRPQAMSYCNTSPCCERDLYPSQCNFVAGSNMCNDQIYRDICCCTCHMTAGMNAMF